MKETAKTATVVLVVLIISIGTVFAYVYAFESGFLSRTYYEKQSDNIDSADKKIVIIGSSQIAILKPSEISELSSGEEKYAVYNLFENADAPLKRIEIIDDILEIKPDLVLYGIGLNSFGWGNISNISESRKCVKISNDEIPNETSKIIQKKSNDIIYENQEDSSSIFGKSFFKTINPKQLTIEIIKKIVGKTNEPITENNFDSIDTKKSISELERINSKDFGMCINMYENQYNALKKIIDIIKQNEINIILFIPPYDVEYFTYMPESVENSLRITIHSIADEKELEMYDLSHKYDGLDIFKDITHLEEKYASVYLEEIGSIIKIAFENHD